MPDKFAVVDTMALLFVVSGMSARYYLQSHTTKQFVKDKTRKLLVPSTIGLFVFQWLLGMKPLCAPPFPLDYIEEMTALMGGDGRMR